MFYLPVTVSALFKCETISDFSLRSRTAVHPISYVDEPGESRDNSMVAIYLTIWEVNGFKFSLVIFALSDKIALDISVSSFVVTVRIRVIKPLHLKLCMQ